MAAFLLYKKTFVEEGLFPCTGHVKNEGEAVLTFLGRGVVIAKLGHFR